MERGCEEADDSESPGPVGGFGVGDGDGVRVGDVLLEVDELPDWGLFFSSIFYKTDQAREVTTAVTEAQLHLTRLDGVKHGPCGSGRLTPPGSGGS